MEISNPNSQHQTPVEPPQEISVCSVDNLGLGGLSVQVSQQDDAGAVRIEHAGRPTAPVLVGRLGLQLAARRHDPGAGAVHVPDPQAHVVEAGRVAGEVRSAAVAGAGAGLEDPEVWPDLYGRASPARRLRTPTDSRS